MEIIHHIIYKCAGYTSTVAVKEKFLLLYLIQQDLWLPETMLGRWPLPSKQKGEIKLIKTKYT